MQKHIYSAGFAPPAEHPLGRERRTVAFAELIATLALASSIIVAATAVTIGIARADVAGDIVDSQFSLFAGAMLLGLLFIGVGGMSVLTLGHRHRHR